MTARRTRVADLGAGLIGVWSDYAFKDRLKAMPGARWDAHQRCWVMPNVWRSEVEELLGLRPTTRGSSATSSLADAAALFLLALPLGLRRPAYRALIRITHPDVGGSDETARELLAGAERAGVR